MSLDPRQRQELDRYITGNYGEDQIKDEPITGERKLIQDLHDRLLVRNKELSEARMPLTVDDVLEMLRHFSEDLDSKELESEPLDPLNSMGNRATVAENMLDNYHLLKTNLKTREAIHRLLHDRGAISTRTAEAYQLVVQAQAELDQCKFEILELMGVDS